MSRCGRLRSWLGFSACPLDDDFVMILSLDVVVASLLRSGVARRAAAFLAWIFSLSLTSSSSVKSVK
jgi:hypothetical protein